MTDSKSQPRPAAGDQRIAEQAYLAVLRRYGLEGQIKGLKTLRLQMTIALVLVLGFFLSSWFLRADRVYIAIDETNRVIELVPLSQPNQKDGVVATFVGRALVDTFDFHFGNMDARLNDAYLRWFTRRGADAVEQSMADQKIKDNIKKTQSLVTLTLEGTPLLAGHGQTAEGDYSWIFQAKVLLTYRSLVSGKETTVKLLMTSRVVRRSLLEDASGLGIDAIVMEQRND